MGDNRETGLPDRWHVYIEHYLADPTRNGTQAAIKAGYSETRAKVTSSEILADERVQAILAQRLAAVSAATDVTVEKIIREYAALAFLDPRMLFDEHGNLLPPLEWPEEVARAIASFDVSTALDPVNGDVTTVSKVKFWSKPTALQDLGRVLRMFVEQKETTLRIVTEDMSDDEIRREIVGLVSAPKPANAA